MILRVGELISYNNILARSKIQNGGGARRQNPRSKVNLKEDYDFPTNKSRIRCNTFFRVILTTQSIPYIILMIQGHLQCQKVNFRSIKNMIFYKYS